jgi:hypothetical protein
VGVVGGAVGPVRVDACRDVQEYRLRLLRVVAAPGDRGDDDRRRPTLPGALDERAEIVAVVGGRRVAVVDAVGVVVVAELHV